MQNNLPHIKTQTNISNHQFFMKKIQSTNPSKFVSIQFSHFSNNLCTENLNASKIYPTYYHTKQPYFPTFILPIDEKNYIEKRQTFLQIHQHKKLQALQEKQDLFVPMPSAKNKCCCVCRCYYQDYLTHIKSKQHKVASMNNEFNKDIIGLCTKFDQSKKRKSSKLDKSLEFENQKPRKKIKTEKVQKEIQFVKPIKMGKNNSQTMTSIGSDGGSVDIQKEQIQ